MFSFGQCLNRVGGGGPCPNSEYDNNLKCLGFKNIVQFDQIGGEEAAQAMLEREHYFFRTCSLLMQKLMCLSLFHTNFPFYIVHHLFPGVHLNSSLWFDLNETLTSLGVSTSVTKTC